MVAAYLSRWRVEETIRFLKQSYQLEDIRVLSYVRLQNMMAILTAVAYFTAVYLVLRLKLRILMKHVLRAARRVFGVPDFRLYALADGIKHFLFSQSKLVGWGRNFYDSVIRSAVEVAIKKSRPKMGCARKAGELKDGQGETGAQRQKGRNEKGDILESYY